MKCEGFTATATMKDVPLKIGGEYCWEDNARGYDPHKVTQINSADFTDGNRQGSYLKEILAISNL